MDQETFARQTEANSRKIAPLTGEELAALEAYRATWRPYRDTSGVFDITLMRGAHVRLRRWTVKGMGPSEYGVAFLSEMPESDHFRPMDVDGLQVFLCFFPANATRNGYQYPIGHRDEVEILGVFDMLESNPGPESWHAKNADLFAAWSKMPAVDLSGMSDPITMIEYMKANNLSDSTFGWRSATHYSNLVTHAYRDMFVAAAGDTQKLARVNAKIEETGMDWFPAKTGDFLEALR